MVQDLIDDIARALRGAVFPRAPFSLVSRGGGRPADAVFAGVPDRATDSLILGLASDLRPVTHRSLPGRLVVTVGAGMVMAAFWVGAARGFRPSPMHGALAMAVMVKVGYASLLGAPSLWAATRLARPDGDGAASVVWIGAPVVLLAAVALGHGLATPAMDPVPMWLGHTALVCPLWIVAASLPSLAGLIGIMRGQAPTRPALTGAFLGLAAGAAGAVAYALFCRETGLGFIALWYSAGMAGASALGALVGARCLRW